LRLKPTTGRRSGSPQPIGCDWQIELAFKRMKSLIGLEGLRAKDADLARLWINIALLAALLAEDDLPALDPEAPDSLPLAA
ncbi:hypothetical protein Rleg9DRAFT_6830, partial [Rhizobium leguminosarum bv. trifolii WSM597]